MSIKSEIERIKTNVAAAYVKIAAKGGTAPPSQVSANLADAIDSIPTGSDTSDATAAAGDILSGKTAYAGGAKIEGAMPVVEQAVPVISVSTGGHITATAAQAAGYVEAGERSAREILPFQAATTITPGTSDKLAVAKGLYTIGDVYVAGDANLTASNIKAGASIFGVEGTYAGSGEAGGEPCRVTIPQTSTVTSVGIAYINKDGNLACAMMSGGELAADVVGTFVVSASVSVIYYLTASSSNASSIRYGLEGQMGANMVVITPKPGAAALTVTLGRSKTSPV